MLVKRGGGHVVVSTRGPQIKITLITIGVVVGGPIGKLLLTWTERIFRHSTAAADRYEGYALTP